jgi:hypothetical protein
LRSTQTPQALVAQVRQIAQENKAAWLPNPVVHRLMSEATQVQRRIATQLESSSSSIENLAIALDVLQERHYQSSPNSLLQLKTTGKGLGGASKAEIQELRTQVTIAEKQVDVFRLYINKTQKKLDKTNKPESRSKYMGRLREFEQDLVQARAALSQAQNNLSNALDGASSSSR